MKSTATPLADARVIEADRFPDQRGWFAELWNRDRYREAGLDVGFVQSNASYSRSGVLRGMHFQHPSPQAKLVSVLRGRVFDVIVDVRIGSPTYGGWFGLELSAESQLQLFVPEGFAHGFLVTGDDALVHYSCSSVFHAESERALAWDDPAIRIAWPFAPAVISDKDRAASSLAVLAKAGHLPHFDGQ